MNQTEKTEWITELAKCRYKVLMRNHIPAPYKSAADEALEWRNAWRAAREMYFRDWKRNMKKVHFIIQAFHKIDPDYENHKSYMISQWIDEQMKMI